MASRPLTSYDLYLQQTPSQTLGPFFHQGLVRTRSVFQSPGLCPDDRAAIGNVLFNDGSAGPRIRIEGGVFDGLGEPVADALLEIWQANAEGHHHHPLDGHGAHRGEASSLGFGRAPTDERGAYYFETLKPGPVPWLGGVAQAPHVNVILGARGMARHAFTRIYFFDSDAALAQDPVLLHVPAERRHTLIARATAGRAGVPTYHFDIHLQGESETVFFEL
jgi:protocatechuate 3,4-dioxygenase alpha subunit